MEDRFDPIPIRPLTMRGVFGITWAIMKRRLMSIVLFTFVIYCAVAAVLALFAVPVIGSFSDMIEGSVSSAALIILGVIAMLIVALAVWLVLCPIVNGTVYTEMSMRVYGQSSSFSQLFIRSRFALKRFFTLSLCQSLASWIAGIAISLINSLLTAIFTVGSVFGAFLSVLNDTDMFVRGYEYDSALGIVLIAIAVLISLIVSLCVKVPLSFTYPAAVNENKKNFAAVGRSLTLGFKRYGRTLWAKLLFTFFAFMAVMIAYALIVAIAAIGYLALKRFAIAETVLIVFAVAALLFITAFIGTYSAALDTVLYLDTYVRTDGEPSAQNNGSSDASDEAGEQSSCETASEECRSAPMTDAEYVIQSNDINQGENDTTL